MADPVSTPRLLERAAQERLRGLAPAFWIGVVVHVAIAPSLGVELATATYVFDGIMLLGLTAATAAVLARRIPLRWAHTAFAGVLWTTAATTIAPMYTGANAMLVHLVFLESLGVGILLDTGWAIATIVAFDLALVPAIFVCGVPDPAMTIAALATANVFGFVIHRVIRRTVLDAETHRDAEAATARELARQVEQLKTARAEQAQLQDQLLHSQRMEAVGTLAAGLAHDMNNVLAAVTNFAALALDEIDAPSARTDVEQIIAQANRGAALTRGLLAFSRRGQYRKRIVPLSDVVNELLPLLGRMLPKSIEIQTDVATEDVFLEGDPQHLGQILVNLALNASDAMAGSGKLQLSTRVTALAAHPLLPAGAYARIDVCDTGCGMDELTRSRIFEPFFTTKPAGGGTGLGLSTVWGIVNAHGGAVEVESAPGHGTAFTIHLPLTDKRSSPRAGEGSPAPAIRNATVLVVDDEPAVRNTTRRLLERAGLEVLVASDGAEALRTCAANLDRVRVVVLDMKMPTMGGAECFDRLRAMADIPVIIATGYAIDAEVQALVGAGARLLEKPFAASDLLREVRFLLGLTPIPFE